MKKTKIFTGVVATGLLAATPALITLTSCNPKKPTSSIHIKTNPNIDIECKKIEVGKQLTIKYNLKSDFGFDLAKSTITFGNSNTVVSLLECEVDRDNKIITVPAKYVTSTQVTIDIKAESSESTTVTEAQFNEAIETLTQYTDARSFSIVGTGTVKQYDPTGKETSSQNFSHKINALGYKDYFNFCTTTETTELPIVQYWGEKDDIVGAWQYAHSYDAEEAIKAPATRTFASAFCSELLVYSLPGYKKMTYDTLYNAYYAKWTDVKQECVAALKFDGNHKLKSFGYTTTEKDELTSTTEVTTLLFNVDYSSPSPPSIPTHYKIASEMMYEDANEYKFANNQLECAIHPDGLFGRFDIPMSKYTSFDKTKDLTMKLDHNVNAGGCEASVSVNGVELSSDLYTFDDTKYILTIKKEAYSSLSQVQKLNIVLANPGFGGYSPTVSPTKFIICQEVDIKSVTLTPDKESFEAFDIPLKNYTSQTITNDQAGASTAYWPLDTTITTEQRYKLEIETSSEKITKTIKLHPSATTFDVSFTTAEWSKLTNGASITIEPDYIDKTCPVVADSSFTDYFDIVQIDPGIVKEDGDREIEVYIRVNQKPQHKAGKASLVLQSDTSVVIDERDIPQAITTPFTFNFSVNSSGTQWSKIPYDDAFEIHYKVNE